MARSSHKKPFWVPSCLQAEGGKKGGCLRTLLRVPVPVSSLEHTAILLSYIGYFALCRRDGKTSFCPGCHSPHMHPCISEVSRNARAHQIASAKPMGKVLLLGFAAWEACLIHQAHLAATVAGGRDKQGHDPLHLHGLRGALSHTSSVYPVPLR